MSLKSSYFMKMKKMRGIFALKRIKSTLEIPDWVNEYKFEEEKQ